MKADRQVTFRIVAPKAESVRLAAGDIPGQHEPTTTSGSARGWPYRRTVYNNSDGIFQKSMLLPITDGPNGGKLATFNFVLNVA